MVSDRSRETALATATARLRALAPSLAVMLDFDGVLAPIVADPSAVEADPAAVDAIRRLADALPLVAVVTGRPALQARALLGIDGIAYTGLHGAEVLAPGAAAPATPQAFLADAAAVHRIVDEAAADPGGLAGLEVERKGPIVALHWRSAVDPAAAEARAHVLGERAVAAGLRSGVGRAVLEIRPALELTKGDGVAALLAGEPRARHALFAGDDITDLDAFVSLRALTANGTIESATLVAVAGHDAPPAVAAAADLVVCSPAELGALLAELTTAPAPAAAAPASPPREP